jgi:hypothetical protein
VEISIIVILLVLIKKPHRVGMVLRGTCVGDYGNKML